MDYCHQTYGLIQDFTAENVWKYLVDDQWVKTTNGNESGERMVFGWNTILWRSGVCTGKDTGIKQTEREIAAWLLVIKNKPGYGQKKEGGYAQNEKLKPSCGRGEKHLTKPSAFESEIHPSHKLRLCSVYFALPGANIAGNGSKFVNGCRVHPLTNEYGRIYFAEDKEGVPIGRNSFIQMTKLSNVKGRITYISSHAKQENLYAVYETTERKFWRELAKCNQEEFAKKWDRRKMH